MALRLSTSRSIGVLILLILLTGLIAAAVPVGLAAQDWPQWRGPNRDGAVAAFKAPASWPGRLTEQWKVEVGLGYATPLVVGDRVYMFSRQNDDEVMTALDAKTGQVVWRTPYPAPFKMSPATARHGAGPKSTPTFADGRLFTLGMSGIVSAFDATAGKLLWQHPAPPTQPLYHTAMSPVVDGDRVIVHIGGHNDGALTAFDVATGKVLWQWDGDGPAYGSPVILTIGGTRQVVTFTQENLVGVDAATGQLLWRRPFTTPSSTTAQTPYVYKDLIIQTGRENGITAFRVRKQGDKWTTENVWQTSEASLHMSDGVIVDGVLFGLSHLNRGQYFALDLESGKVLWTDEGRQAEHAAIARNGNTIFSLEDDGELVVARGGRSGLEPLARYEVATSATWAQPAISGNRIYVKDVSTLALWTLE
jgi:outer membrane protein assembly factor BamB